MGVHSSESHLRIHRYQYEVFAALAATTQNGAVSYYNGSLYKQGVEITAYYLKDGENKGYYFSFELHYDQLLRTGDRITLPAVEELKLLRQRFIEVLAGTDIGTILLFSLGNPLDFSKLGQVFDTIHTCRVDYAVQLTGLSTEEMRVYARALNQGRWGDLTTYIPEDKTKEPPKTFETSCYLEQRVQTKDGAGESRLRINFYDKNHCFTETQYKRKHPVAPDELDRSKGIFRIEVQVYKPVLEYLSSADDKPLNITGRYLPELLTAQMSFYFIKKYLVQLGGVGDYYKRSTAKKKIQQNKSLRMHQSTKDGICAMLDFIDNAYKTNNNMLNLDEVLKSLNLPYKTKRNYLEKLEALNINPVPLPNSSPYNSLSNLWERVKGQFPPELPDGLPTVQHRVYSDLYRVKASPYGKEMPERYRETKANINALAKLVQLKPNRIYWLPAADTNIHAYKWYEDSDEYNWRSEHRNELLANYIVTGE